MSPDHRRPAGAPRPRAGRRGPPPRRAAPAACALLGAALLLAPPARAQVSGAPPDLSEVPLEALLDLDVEAVALQEEQAATAAASVVVVTGQELRDQGHRTLQEALRGVPGLFTYRDDLFPSVGVRGLGLPGDYTTRLLVLLDGHPLDNSVGIGESYLGRDLPVPLAAVDRIEVIKGPVGSVYGPTAFLGVVNVVTRHRADGGEARLGGEAAQGRPRGGDAVAWHGATAGPLHLLVAAEAAGSRGVDWTFPELVGAADRPAPPGGRVAGADRSAAGSGYLRLDWQGLSLAGACASDDRGLPSAPYSAILGATGTRVSTRTCFVDAAGTWAVGSGVSLFARAAYDDFDYRDRFAYDPPPDSYGTYKDLGTDRWATAEGRATWRPSPGVLLVGGATAQRHATRQRAWSVDDPGVGSGRIDKDFSIVGAYLLAEVEPSARLRLHGGLTFTDHSIFGHRFSPKLAAVWSPTAGDAVKAILSTGLRAPTMSEANFEDGTDYLANPALRPERVRSAELAWEHRLGGGAALTAALFASRYDDLIQFVTVPAPGLPGPPDPAVPSDWRAQGLNVAHLSTWGGELSGVVRRGRRLTLTAGLSAQGTDWSPRANFPALTGAATVAARPWWDRLQLLGRVAFQSARDKDPSTVLPGTRPRLPAAAVVDLGANLDLPGPGRLSLQALLLNALSAAAPSPAVGDFAPVTEFPQPPRTLRLVLRGQWE